MDIQWVSGNDYRVTLKLFRDCANGGAGFDNSVRMTVYENGTNNFVTQFNMGRKGITSLVLGDECYTPPSSVCMEEGIYTELVTFNNNPNGYYMAWERCCRSPLNLNIEPSQSMVFYAQMADPSIKNSTPRFGNYPVNGYMCTGITNYFDFDVSDIDGDDLVYSLITPLNGSATSPQNAQSNTAGTKPYDPVDWEAGYGLTNIVGGTPNMSIDPNTGIITCSPTQIGAFTFSVLVEEFRAGVKIGEIIRDIQFFALDCQKKVASVNQTPTTDDTALEGCIQAQFIFELDQTLSKDTTICYNIEGSAINGVDYALLEDCITIAAGQTTATIIIDAYADGITEGVEDIYLIYNPIPCVDFVTDTVFLYIDDAEPIDFVIDKIDLTCNGDFTGEIDLAITGGFSPYVITVTPDGGTPTVYSDSDLPLTGLAAGTYTIEVDDIYGCGGTSQVVGNLFDGGPVFLPDGNGDIISNVLPISGLNQATLQSPDELQAICLNMEHSSLGDVSMRLVAPDGTVLLMKERFNQNDGGHTDLGEPVAKNKSDGGNAAEVTPGIGYDYCFTATPTYATMVDEHTNYQHTYVDQLGKTLTDDYLPSGSYTSYAPFTDLIGVPLNGDWTLEVEDHNPNSNGYVFEWSISFKIDGGAGAGGVITITEPNPIDITLAGTVTQASCNGSDGSIDIDVVGDFPNFTFQWDDAATSTTEDISGLPAGNYTVEVTDDNGCMNTASFTVSNASGPTISATVQDEQCAGENNGSIDATFTTGGSIASISWDSGQSTEDISGLSAGDYTVTVTDNSGCISVETFTINAAAELFISGTVINERCGDMEGEIDITVSGGDGNYTFSWDNGAGTEDITDLNQNTYEVTVTDGNGCQIQMSFDVINTVGNCTPNCDLVVNNATIVDETCGQANGSITLSVYTTNTPHSVSWSNGMTGDAITGLAAGTYTATITDVETCEVIVDYTVINDAGDLAISNPILSDEVCGAGNGAIDVTVTGGDGNYTFSWDNGAGTEDITGLSAGSYTITVTDGTGCSVSAQFDVVNDAGSMAISFENTVDETCGNGQGSIDINISPNGSYTYAWDNGGNTQDLTGLSAGDYTCTITDNNTGCELTTPTYTINNDAGSLTVVITDFDNEVCGNGMGEIDITISGGAPNYNFLWSNTAITEDITGLSAGTYSADIVDQNGCTVNTGDITIVNEPGSLSVEAFTVDEVCGNGQGEVDLVITGGTPNYNTSWSSGQNTEDITGLSAGNYTYTVTDQNGCEVVSTAAVADQAGTLSIDNVSVTDATCGATDGAIDITVSGGDGNYTFSWSSGQGTEDITGVTNGTYTITLTDGAGCEIVQDIDVNGTLVLASSSITGDLCGAGVGAIDIEISGGTTYTYVWSNGETTEDIINLTTGTYSVVVTSFEGCTYSDSFVVGNDPTCNEMCLDTYSAAGAGKIFDSGGSNNNYQNNENCSFLIEPFCAESITLSFVEFRLENNVDFLSVYEGIDNTGTLIGSYTGTNTPSNITINSGAMFLEYSTDISNTDTGFEADWTSVQITNLPVASFTVSNANPYIGEVVSFTDASTDAFTWSWDVDGDGFEDYTTQNPTHTYTMAGTYTVTLTITNCNGTDTFTFDVVVQERPIIEVTPALVFDVTIDDCADVINETITIANIGSLDLTWDISNATFTPTPNSGLLTPGSSEDVLITIPAYPNAGNYTEVFTITSNDPQDPTIDVVINITQTAECYGPVINATPTNVNLAINECTEVINQIITIESIGISDLTWSISNATFTPTPSSGTLVPGTSEDVLITIPAYEYAGIYVEVFTITSNDPQNPTVEVTLTINQTTDCYGLFCFSSGSTSTTGTIVDSGDTGGNYGNDENCGYLIQPECIETIDLSFLMIDILPLDTLYIYEGMDATGTLLDKVSGTSTPSNIQVNTGSIYVEFISNSVDVAGGFELYWTSTPSLVTDFEIGNVSKFANKRIPFFDVTDGNVTSWSWDFGDGLTSVEENPEHVFAQEGCYTVTLTVEDENGCIDTTTKEICVEKPVNIDVYPNPSNGVYTIDVNSKEIEVKVYNLIGELVDHKLLKLNEYKYLLDITEKADASYILRVNEEVFKIMKQD